jgi:hypothetical protein
VLRGVLESAALFAVVADAQLAQTNAFLTQGNGGVRVLVRRSQEAEARQALDDYRAGALALADDELTATSAESQTRTSMRSAGFTFLMPTIAAMALMCFVVALRRLLG